MNIQTIKTNLKNTITGKEKYLAELRKKYDQTGVSSAVADFLEISINENKRILQDVEALEDQLAADAR